MASRNALVLSGVLSGVVREYSSMIPKSTQPQLTELMPGVLYIRYTKSYTASDCWTTIVSAALSEKNDLLVRTTQ